MRGYLLPFIVAIVAIFLGGYLAMTGYAYVKEIGNRIDNPCVYSWDADGKRYCQLDEERGRDF